MFDNDKQVNDEPHEVLFSNFLSECSNVIADIIMNEHLGETLCRPYFFAFHTGNQPRLLITYEMDPLGIESFWAYHENVNVFNGNLVINEEDVLLPGRGVPIRVTRTYNSRAYSPTVYPLGTAGLTM